MTEELDSYITSHISPEPAHLAALYRDTHLRRLYPRMCSGHYQGRLLKMLTTMINPAQVLELGTFTGYSALCIAEGLDGDARLHTVEINDEMEDDLLELFARSPGGDRVTLHIGDACDVIARLDPTVWDLVYIDANKRNYTDYYEMIVPRLRPGGFIIADNTLWDGKVADPDANHDAQTRGIVAFNDLVANDDRVETVIIPLRDGLTIIRKKLSD